MSAGATLEGRTIKKVDNGMAKRRWDNKQLLRVLFHIISVGDHAFSREVKLKKFDIQIFIMISFNFWLSRLKLLINIFNNKRNLNEVLVVTPLTMSSTFFRYILCLYYLHFHDFSVSWLLKFLFSVIFIVSRWKLERENKKKLLVDTWDIRIKKLLSFFLLWSFSVFCYSWVHVFCRF